MCWVAPSSLLNKNLGTNFPSTSWRLKVKVGHLGIILSRLLICSWLCLPPVVKTMPSWCISGSCWRRHEKITMLPLLVWSPSNLQSQMPSQCPYWHTHLLAVPFWLKPLRCSSAKSTLSAISHPLVKADWLADNKSDIISASLLDNNFDKILCIVFIQEIGWNWVMLVAPGIFKMRVTNVLFMWRSLLYRQRNWRSPYWHRLWSSTRGAWKYHRWFHRVSTIFPKPSPPLFLWSPPPVVSNITTCSFRQKSDAGTSRGHLPSLSRRIVGISCLPCSSRLHNLEFSRVCFFVFWLKKLSLPSSFSHSFLKHWQIFSSLNCSWLNFSHAYCLVSCNWLQPGSIANIFATYVRADYVESNWSFNLGWLANHCLIVILTFFNLWLEQ